MRNIAHREAVCRGAMVSLMWAFTMTHTSIIIAVHAIANAYNNPGMTHCKAVAEVPLYLPRTKDLELTQGGRQVDVLNMSVYVDADHATCKDMGESVSGRAVLLGGQRLATPGFKMRTQGMSALVTS